MNNMTYKIKENAKNVWIRNNENTQDLSPLTDANSVYFNNGRTLEQELGKGAMESNIVTVNSSMEKVIDEAYDGVYESCVFKGKTKWIDNDTQEILDDFVNGRNLSLIDCKMPGLTTTGKNLFDGELMLGNVSGSNGIDLNSNKMCRTNYIKVTPGSDFTASIEGNYVVEKISEVDKDKNFIRTTEKNIPSISVTLTNSTSFIRCVFKHINNPNEFSLDEVRESKIQLEESPTATPYEPYKSNILSTLEEIILREVGGVCDSYDALTGEYVQRIGEREYQEGDLDNSSVVTDLAKTQYILDKPVTTIVEPSTIPFIYQNGHIILESGYEGQSLLPTLEYTAMTNRTGQVENVAKTIQRHEAQLTLLEKMLITNIIELDYNNTLMALNLKMDEVK